MHFSGCWDDVEREKGCATKVASCIFSFWAGLRHPFPLFFDLVSSFRICSFIFSAHPARFLSLVTSLYKQTLLPNHIVVMRLFTVPRHHRHRRGRVGRWNEWACPSPSASSIHITSTICRSVRNTTALDGTTDQRTPAGQLDHLSYYNRAVSQPPTRWP